MSRKTFYRYNPATDGYERVYPSARQRLWSVLRQTVIGVAAGIGVALAAYYIIDFPREKKLRDENQRLRASVELLDRRSDRAIDVMEDIMARDNNFYRVMLQADPLPPGRRLAGLERQRLYQEYDTMPDYSLVGAVTDKLDLLDHMIYAQSNSFDELRQQAASLKDRAEHVPAIPPVSAKHLKQMASGYGYRRDPVYGTSRFHEGMDFAADIGTPVYATADGVVDWADWKSTYGNLIELRHGYNYTTRYAHLSKILVKKGQMVKRGDQIGLVGNTGKSTGPHLHYEVRLAGQPQNPVNYYFYDLSPEEYDAMIRRAENAGHVMD